MPNLLEYLDFETKMKEDKSKEIFTGFFTDAIVNDLISNIIKLINYVSTETKRLT